jgi:hypothetical protein
MRRSTVLSLHLQLVFPGPSLFPKVLIIFVLSRTMEQHALENVNNSLNTNIYSYLETSGNQSSYLYLNVIRFLNSVN